MALAQAIMTALIDEDLSGSELARDFSKSLGFFWNASHQQIYQELRKLTDKGWLEKREASLSEKSHKNTYGITLAGREALAEWVYEETKNQSAKDELLLKLYNLNEENTQHLAGQISQRRDDMMTRLYLYEAIRRHHYDDPEQLPVRHKGVYLALSFGILQGEQFLAWCDQALQVLAGIDTVDH